MQAITLATGDKFLVQYNLTIDTSDVLDLLEMFLIDWNDSNFGRIAFFDDEYGIDFAVIVGPSGLCYNFNLANPNELFNLKMLFCLSQEIILFPALIILFLVDFQNISTSQDP